MTHVDCFVYVFGTIWIYMTVDILSDETSHSEILLLLTLNEARGADCEDFCVIHPSGSTSQSVTNTGRTAQHRLSLSNIWHKPKGQICHPTLSNERKSSHVCHPCQKLMSEYFPESCWPVGRDRQRARWLEGWVSNPVMFHYCSLQLHLERCQVEPQCDTGEQVLGQLGGRSLEPWLELLMKDRVFIIYHLWKGKLKWKPEKSESAGQNQ